jgi:hypothetical protein
VSAPTGNELVEVTVSGTAILLVSEIFGPTFQGERPSIGRRCSFLRLGHEISTADGVTRLTRGTGLAGTGGLTTPELSSPE